MNWDRIKGKWRQLAGSVKDQWGKLTDDEIARIDGNREMLVGAVQEKYGVARDEAERQADAWMKRQ